MKIDVIKFRSEEIKNKLREVGFQNAISIEDCKVFDAFKDKITDLTAYHGKDYEFVIRKGKANIIFDLENEGFILNKGLCSKLKENKIFVLFSFSSLLDSNNMFKVYKNLLINGKICNDYGVNCIYSSFADNATNVLSPFQLESFAAEFGYNYKNMLKAYEELKKAL
ncbi:MAG: hypothetical protein BJBARM5_0268 [Candidatus Parvarchaeum acidophilus ARMAN-5]|jgi:hypothetical protein|uniref:Uncharacterized protein n=1 Tax=Candidatus Parvarchaeum acidophilus ARMAN-5 TaxID=662762 RepID=D6GUW9_PARA5|nr:MAG: hypothetical protein BJBARM5_0268 [Candidatus Parvarchaeum acidophilus ARMAN-5]